MSKKRMFSLGVLDTDAFLDMPLSAQALYFHLNLRADDDGFIGNPKRIVQIIGARQSDLKLLIEKRFVLLFEDGVIVIKHWRMHNAIKADRYTKTNFIDDLERLTIKENGAYTICSLNAEHKWSTNGAQTENAFSVGIGKDKELDKGLDKDLDKGEVRFLLPTKDSGLFEVDEMMMEHYSKLYPNVDVDQEFRSMQGWLEANEQNRKTKKGMKRFINGWLNRANDKPRKKSFIEAANELEEEGWVL